MDINACSTARSIALSTIIWVSYSAQAAVEIDHDAIDEARSGKRIEISTKVSVEGDTGDTIREVRTYFRADNDGRWHYVPMSGSDNQYQGLLPAPGIHTNLVRYQFLVITAAKNLAKSEIYNIEIEKDEDALARLDQKPPRDIKIDVSDVQDTLDLYDELRPNERITSADRQNIARESGEASPDSRVDIRSEYNPANDTITGFSDYINLSYVAGAKGYGVAAGIVGASAAAASAPDVASVSSATAASGGSGVGWLLGGVAVVAGGAAAASGGGGGGDDGGGGGGGGGGNPPPGQVTNFGSRWTGPQVCAATGNAAFRWVVDLNQNNDQVSGIIAFHECPGGGRATYNVNGTATAAASVNLNGTFASGQGPLGGTAPANQAFTVSVGQGPNPNFAP